MMPPTQCQIHYFSGTGNARHVADWIYAEFAIQKIETAIINIAKLNNRRFPERKPDSLIGFVAPTHGFNFPPIMLHYILKFPRAKNNSVFIVNTRAGMKAGKLFLPGLSGLAQLFTAWVLVLKGYKILGMRSIDLPSNWISLHPGLKEKVALSIFDKCKTEVENFAGQLANGKRSLKSLRDVAQDLAISPVAILYYVIGRFIIAKTFVASSDCTKCKLCQKECPVNAIKWVSDRPFWTHHCESCMRCMNSCPKNAIETAHGFLIGVLLIINSGIFVLLYNKFSLEHFFAFHFSVFSASLFRFFIDSVVFLLLFILIYRFMHFLMRFKFFERLVITTSLTHYKFWRRYKLGLKK